MTEMDPELGGSRAGFQAPLPPPGHALVAVDQVLKDPDLYVSRLAPQLPMPVLVRAMLLHVLYALGPDEVAIEHLSYNRLFQWFLGEGWLPGAYVASRAQLVELDGEGSPFARAVTVLELQRLLRAAPFRPDEALLDAWSCEALLAFEDLGRMGNLSLQCLIRALPLAILGEALWEVPEPFFQRFADNMSVRNAAIMEEGMSHPRAPRPYEIEQARAHVLKVAKLLARRQEITLP